MDIHFCDLCGVRVTDVDLRGGHGIRKQYDVICATCLELGHGKEWLASHQRGKAATAASQPATQPAAAALAANTSNKQAPIVTIARDRVQTLEEGDDSPAVTPQVLSADETDDGVATSELVNEEVAEEAAKQQPNNQFAAAASSFSALASTSRKVDAAADVEEGSDRGEGLSDESTSAPILADKQGEDATAGDDGGESPFGFKDERKDNTSQKDETLPDNREPLVSDKANGDKKKSSSGSASFKKSGTSNKTSSANGKSGGGKAGRSGKSPTRKVNKNKNILMMSALSIGILSMVLLITIKSLKKPQKEQERIEVDLSENVKTAIKDAKFKATKALNSGGVSELEAARSQIQAIVPEITIFEKAAKGQTTPWTDEQMGDYLQNIGWTDLNSLNINIGQKIAKLKVGGQ